MWELIDSVTGIFVSVMAIYGIFKVQQLEKKLAEADQRLMDETVKRLNGDDF